MPPAIDLSRLRQAINSLRAALHPPPANDRERDGAIQRFEYTFELAWKSAARVLASEGIVVASPRAVLRELGALGWVSSVELWFDFLEMRNQTSHVYREEVADAVFARVGEFAEAVILLAQKLEQATRRDE